MKKYRFLKDVMLSFLSGREQADCLVGPQDDSTLEFDGKTIWVVKGDKRQESITTGNAIPLWLERGNIEEII